MKYRLFAACGCSIGKRRGNNEDNFYFDGHYLPAENHALDGILTQVCTLEQAVDFCVFDGMGGQADGQIASNLAAITFDRVHKNTSLYADPQTFQRDVTQQMTDTVWNQADESFSNMGTTAAMLRFCKDSYYLCNVGDSRIFLFRDSILKQISVDHTDEQFLKDNGISRHKPSLTQYIGVSPDELMVEPYLSSGALAIGDQYLICSDGLTDMVSNERISNILAQNATSERKVAALIQTALENGGRDNITVILIQVEDAIKTSGQVDAAIDRDAYDVLQELTAALDDNPKTPNTAAAPEKIAVPPEDAQRRSELAPAISTAVESKVNEDSDCGYKMNGPKRAKTKSDVKNRKSISGLRLAAITAAVLIIAGAAYFFHGGNQGTEKKYTDDGLFYYIEEVTKSNIIVKSTYDSETDALYTIEVYDEDGVLIAFKDYTGIDEIEDSEPITGVDTIEPEMKEKDNPEIAEKDGDSVKSEQEPADFSSEEGQKQQSSQPIQEIAPTFYGGNGDLD